MKALTPEEKAAKLARMKELIAARRAARGEEEKVDHVKVSDARHVVVVVVVPVVRRCLLTRR